MQRFTELRVWQRSHRLAVELYRLTARFPDEERFGLTSQIRRAVVSVSSNVAEGAKRKSRSDYSRLLNIAEGSLAETESLLRISKDLDYADTAIADSMIDECEQIARMLHALRTSVDNPPC